MTAHEILLNETVLVKTADGEEVTVGWADDYLCEEIQNGRNGVLYVGGGEATKAVGVVIVNNGWSRLAETPGGSLLGSIRNTGWNLYDSREEWESLCGDGE